MGKADTKCASKKDVKPRPKLDGKKPRFVCDRCGMKARKKGEVCKPQAI